MVYNIVDMNCMILWWQPPSPPPPSTRRPPMDRGEPAVRAGLHYGGEVHQLVKKFGLRHGYLSEGKVCRRRWKDNNFYFIFQVGVLWRSSFLFEALRLPKKLDLQRTPLLENVCHVGIHVIFSSSQLMKNGEWIQNCGCGHLSHSIWDRSSYAYLKQSQSEDSNAQ